MDSCDHRTSSYCISVHLTRVQAQRVSAEKPQVTNAFLCHCISSKAVPKALTSKTAVRSRTFSCSFLPWLHTGHMSNVSNQHYLFPGVEKHCFEI